MGNYTQQQRRVEVSARIQNNNRSNQRYRCSNSGLDSLSCGRKVALSDMPKGGFRYTAKHPDKFPHGGLGYFKKHPAEWNKLNRENPQAANMYRKRWREHGYIKPSYGASGYRGGSYGRSGFGFDFGLGGFSIDINVNKSYRAPSYNHSHPHHGRDNFRMDKLPKGGLNYTEDWKHEGRGYYRNHPGEWKALNRNNPRAAQEFRRRWRD